MTYPSRACGLSKWGRATGSGERRLASSRSKRKVELIEFPAEAGLKTIEAGSFVSRNGCPRWQTPQVALARLICNPTSATPSLCLICKAWTARSTTGYARSRCSLRLPRASHNAISIVRSRKASTASRRLSKGREAMASLCGLRLMRARLLPTKERHCSETVG